MPLIYCFLALIVVGTGLWLVNNNIPMEAANKAVLNVVLGLMAVGIVLWLVNTYVPMAESIKAILNVFVVIASCVRALQEVGLWRRALRAWSRLVNHHRRGVHEEIDHPAGSRVS